jgi:hypothetical protein
MNQSPVLPLNGYRGFESLLRLLARRLGSTAIRAFQHASGLAALAYHRQRRSSWMLMARLG